MRQRNEDIIQRSIIGHMKLLGATGVVFFAVPNGGARSKVEAAILKGLGVVPGVPDILLFFAGKCFALEIKTADGRLSPEQRSMHLRLQAAGVTVATTHGLDDALRQLREWGLLRGSTGLRHVS